MADEMALDKEKESWMNSKWRPAMGWMYMAVCITDFILYPVLWAIFQAANNVTPVKPWEPLTLQGAGLFHIAMGAVLGVAAFGRTQEKIAGANNGGIPATGFGVSTPTSSSISTPTSSNGFGTTSASGGTSTGGFGSTFATTPSGKTIIPAGNDPEK